MADPIVALLGDKVQGKDGEVQVSSLRKEGVLGLYFSAHWCPPCRRFTPQLAEWYGKFKKTSNGDKFEIVFVSSDRSEEDCEGYYKDMPWLVLPFSLRAKKEELGKKYQVSGIPTLVFIDSQTGDEITTKARAFVGEDPEGKKFPWK
ncbi:tryparedoxin-like [Amphiura filiformis]|uniref:tryparedoxin-like n=1 Tax=Amphiura filiformis TaxID=82378 RepID=UPI003B227B10